MKFKKFIKPKKPPSAAAVTAPSPSRWQCNALEGLTAEDFTKVFAAFLSDDKDEGPMTREELMSVIEKYK
jgi:hypothetical protein